MKIMKKESSIRKIDDVGRIVIPRDLRRTLEIQEWDELRLYRDGKRIVIEKNTPVCCFCNSEKDLTSFKEKMICGKCLAELKQ